MAIVYPWPFIKGYASCSLDEITLCSWGLLTPTSCSLTSKCGDVGDPPLAFS